MKARVVFACKGCGAEGREGAACVNPRCKSKGKAIEMKCSRSGEFPHGGQP